MKLIAIALLAASLSCFGADLPDKKLTPGLTLNVTEKQVCVKGYSSGARNVTESTRKKIFAEYGITDPKPGQYEIDHLISLELGGANNPANLWPQLYVGTVWNAHVKDALEDRLHSLVCQGSLSLDDAQEMISKNWIAAYKKVFGAQAPPAK